MSGLQGLEGLERRVKKMKRDLQIKTDKAAREGLAHVEHAAKANVVENDSVASTELFRSFKVRHVPRYGSSRWVFENTADHAAFVEFGTGPRHRVNPYTRKFKAPPFTAKLVSEIRQWALVKPSLRGQITDLDVFAWRTARRIAGRSEGRLGGTDPEPFFVPAWQQQGWRVRMKIRQAFEEATDI